MTSLSSRVACFFLFCEIAACRGGGPTSEDLALLPDPTVHARTSYAEMQAQYRFTDRYRFASSGAFIHAFGYGDFDADGAADALVFPGEFLSEVAQPASLTLDIDGAASDGSGVFFDGLPGGIHPRKLLVGDINLDGDDDAVLIDHGYDAEPFPGAPVVYVRSDGAGRQSVTRDIELTGFHHAGALGDFDHDGDLDLFLASSPWQDRPHLLLRNDGTGAMRPTNQLVGRHWNRNIWASEFFDLDGDGYLDLAIGGDNAEGQTKVLWGSSSGSYGREVWTLPVEVLDTYDLDAEDIDGDGDRDLLVTLADLQGNRADLKLFINHGDRVFVDETATRFDVAGHDAFWFDFSFLKDIDGDGDLDLVADDFGTLLSWTNAGGRFAKQLPRRE